jgi:hypothetical protein
MNASTTTSELRSPPVYLWVLILGATGFAAGFFGPIIFAPDANQGPLVGIFISGPGGAILGLILFVIFRAIRIPAAREWQAVAISSALLALVTLYFIMPKPELRGYFIDAQIEKCEPSAQAAAAAVQYWENRIAKVTWAAPRSGWKDDARERLQADQGVVLDVLVLRKNGVYEHTKPWDKGLITAIGWQNADDPKSYYAPSGGGSCADYLVGSRLVRFSPYDLSGLTRGAADWPPREIADFLDRQTLEPVPEKYRKLADE